MAHEATVRFPLTNTIMLSARFCTILIIINMGKLDRSSVERTREEWNMMRTGL